MAEMETSIVVEAPLREVYNQWTQFEDFPKFMDDRRSATGGWRGEIHGQEVTKN